MGAKSRTSGKSEKLSKKSSSSSLTPSQSSVSVNGKSSLSQAQKTNSLTPSKSKKNKKRKHVEKNSAGLLQFLLVVGGIYGSFLTWAILQERLTTTPYGSITSPEFFKFPIFLNTVQSLFAAFVGYTYLRRSGRKNAPSQTPIFPDKRIILPLLLVATTSSLASPFGYASLSHIDYITFILAKSCKLLPVMFLNVTLFQKRYPLYKYLVISAVTAGVATFTLYAVSPKKASKASFNPERNSSWGLFLLGINLLFDGLTNTTQDYIFRSFQPYTGPQMMCANNVISTLLTLSYLLLSPYLVQSSIGGILGVKINSSESTNELTAALAFMTRHPKVWGDVLGFAVCGAIGQIFIFYTLSKFSSIVLVTVTLTRKMLTMILSVVWFGHKLATAQWVGVGLVFGGIGAETIISRLEKASKDKRKGLDKKKKL